MANEDISQKTSISYDATATNGPRGESGGIGGMELSPVAQMIAEQGGHPGTLVIRPGGDQENGNGYRAALRVNATKYSALPEVEGNMSLADMLTKSGFQGVLDGNRGITFGDQAVNPNKFKDILYLNNEDKAITTLPFRIVNGTKQVDFSIIEDFQDAINKTDQIAQQNGIGKNSE